MVPVGFVLSRLFQIRFQRVPAVFAFALPHVVRVLTHSRGRSSVPVPLQVSLACTDLRYGDIVDYVC